MIFLQTKSPHFSTLAWRPPYLQYRFGRDWQLCSDSACIDPSLLFVAFLRRNLRAFRSRFVRFLFPLVERFTELVANVLLSHLLRLLTDGCLSATLWFNPMMRFQYK